MSVLCGSAHFLPHMSLRVALPSDESLCVRVFFIIYQVA